MVKRIGLAIASGSLLLALSCTENVDRVRPHFGSEGVGLAATRCSQDGDTLQLFDRAFPGGSPVPVSVILDFIALDGETECRTLLLSRFCADGRCTVMTNRRVCFDIGALSAELGAMDDSHHRSARLAQEVESRLAGQRISGDLPGGQVIVRAVLSVQSCEDEIDEGAEPFPGSLVGCAYSCPVHLRSASGPLYLGFDTLHLGCENLVQACSSNEFRIPEN